MSTTSEHVDGGAPEPLETSVPPLPSSTAPLAEPVDSAPASTAMPPGAINPAAPPPPAKNLALVALILGVVAFVLGWVPIVGLILGALAIGFGIAALRRRQRKALAIPGIALGGWGFMTSLVTTTIVVIIALQPQAFSEAFWRSYSLAMEDEALSDAVREEAPAAAAEDDEPVDPAPAAATDFATLDDAGFAAIVADPVAAQGQTYVVYGEVQQFDENTGPCSALILVDDAQQSTWEGYATTAWIAAESGEAVCPEFTGLGALSHIKAWVTVAGSATTEWDDGTTEEVLTLMLRQFEALPALP
ncbi:DUF4190 domain-containing protein [Microbacterium sp. NPDC056044]|uniref:DUF4190 domain-containing protein n=1 Tax=Microbacterium sp. NPDC056044 TaxID=3345690 RepID=UPI0035D7CDA4